MGISRRELIQGGLAAGATMAFGNRAADYSTAKPATPISISSSNGVRSAAKAVELMRAGRDTVEAAVEGVVIVEEDPNDQSVGYGGLPNELGIVELDSCVMHGPTMRAGAVAALQNIKTPSRVARAVMERTDHVLLVGAGALSFAKQMGFQEENLLTEASRKAWLRWKTRLSKEDDWLDDDEINKDFARTGGEQSPEKPRVTGTVTCLALNDKGEISGCTSTSGLAWKLPGRVGDSPIIGAGLYVDGTVGAAGSTGRGEANILVSGARIVVEFMRRGMTPENACLEALKRVAEGTKSARLLDSRGRPNFDLNFYALRKDGTYGGARFTKGGRFAVNDGGVAKMADEAWLYD
jgi:N4-(beta-N-acetylglucosaminyl)-L-asparaginase